MNDGLFRTRLVLFDGSCNFCRRTGKLIGWLNWFGRAELRDVVSEWPALHRRFPQLDHDTCLRDMHVVRSDGQIERGFDGYRSLAWVLPLLWLVLPLLYLPPVRWLGWKVYRQVADHRSCAVNPK